jgi:hypothetical protein
VLKERVALVAYILRFRCSTYCSPTPATHTPATHCRSGALDPYHSLGPDTWLAYLPWHVLRGQLPRLPQVQMRGGMGDCRVPQRRMTRGLWPPPPPPSSAL